MGYLYVLLAALCWVGYAGAALILMAVVLATIDPARRPEAVDPPGVHIKR